MKWLGAAALLLATSTAQPAQEVRLAGLAFQLPSAWTVRTDGQYAVIASLTKNYDPKKMPWITANLCDDTASHPCPHGKLDLSRDKSCPAIQSSLHEWPNGIKETRWVCPLKLDQGVRFSSSITNFELGKKNLLVYYLATDHDTPPNEFLDDFAKSLRVE